MKHLQYYIRNAVFFLLLAICGTCALSSCYAAKAIKVTIHVPHQNVKHTIPVIAYVSSSRFNAVKADTQDKKIAYITRILHNNTDNLSAVTKNFTRFNDVRLYFGVDYNPGPGAHIHMLHPIGAKKICGRICMKNANRKQCCAIIICPGNCEC